MIDIRGWCRGACTGPLGGDEIGDGGSVGGEKGVDGAAWCGCSIVLGIRCRGMIDGWWRIKGLGV